MVSLSEQTESTVQVYLPEAAGVFLLGDFNNWSTTATPMSSVGGGLWEVRLSRLAKLRHFGFFVFERDQRFGRVLSQSAAAARHNVSADVGCDVA